MLMEKKNSTQYYLIESSRDSSLRKTELLEYFIRLLEDIFKIKHLMENLGKVKVESLKIEPKRKIKPSVHSTKTIGQERKGNYSG